MHKINPKVFVQTLGFTLHFNGYPFFKSLYGCVIWVLLQTTILPIQDLFV